jgi:hypothetical protein
VGFPDKLRSALDYDSELSALMMPVYKSSYSFGRDPRFEHGPGFTPRGMVRQSWAKSEDIDIVTDR